MDRFNNSSGNRFRRCTSGFALVELLIVITIIGVLASMAVTSMKGVGEQAEDNSARQNAKMIVSVAGGAQAAGDETIAAAANKEAAVVLLSQGLVGEGVFKGTIYKVAIPDSQLSRAMDYLVFRNGSLAFSDSNTSP